MLERLTINICCALFRFKILLVSEDSQWLTTICAAIPTDVPHIMKQTQLKFNKQTPFEETTISDTSSPLPLVTMIRGQTWWVDRAEDHYGSDKPSGTMRVHLSCAGIDAPGRALKEYKAPTFLVGNMLIGAFVCLSVCLCVWTCLLELKLVACRNWNCRNCIDVVCLLDQPDSHRLKLY